MTLGFTLPLREGKSESHMRNCLHPLKGGNGYKHMSCRIFWEIENRSEERRFDDFASLKALVANAIVATFYLGPNASLTA